LSAGYSTPGTCATFRVQDRCQRCRVDLPVGRAWAGPTQLHPRPPHPGAARPHPVPPGSGRGAYSGGPAPGQGPAGCRIKLSSVASDILGRSGRDMLAAMVSGTTDPEILAELARGKLRDKIGELQRALEGRFTTHHALIVESILSKLDCLEEIIDRLSAHIDQVIAPSQRRSICWTPSPGWIDAPLRGSLPRSGWT